MSNMIDLFNQMRSYRLKNSIKNIKVYFVACSALDNRTFDIIMTIITNNYNIVLNNAHQH